MSQKPQPPQIVKLDKAFKMAEQWLSNMTKTADDESIVVEPENLPPRLGLGAKVTRHFRTGPSNDPLDRKLYAKLDAGKRQASRNMEDSTAILNHEDDEDDDQESRTTIFDKRAATAVITPLQAKKKQKHK